MKHICLYLGFFLLAFHSPKLQAQSTYTLSGYIEDSNTGEKLISARVYDTKSGKGVISNNFGFYSLTLEGGEVNLVAAYAGYETLKKSFVLDKDQKLDLTLLQLTLEEVEIVAENEERIEEKTEMSTIEIPIKQIKLLPALFGEVDVIKAIQLLPGVQSGGEGSSGLYVRGGGPDQNLILLDDVPLYYVSHLGGFFSVFNADAINSVKLTKGGFPARYGGRLSSVVDVRMKEGNMKEFHGEGSLGIISSKLSLEGPIIKDKTSFIISARRTYLDLISRPLSKKLTKGAGEFGYFFYDLNGKINHKFSDNDRLYLSAYLGNDNLGIKSSEIEGSPSESEYYRFDLDNKTLWGNKMSALRWNHIWSPKLFSNLTAIYSNYKFSNATDVLDEYNTQNTAGRDTLIRFDGNLKYQSGIRDFGGKLDFDYYPNPNHSIKFGVNGTHHRFVPGLLGLKFNDGEVKTDTTLNDQFQFSHEFTGYVEDEFKIGRRFSANLGLHGVMYVTGKKTYYSLQPRVSARLLINERVSFKASYVQMTQFLHLLSNSGAGLPIDLWVPATERVAPQKSWQAAAGIATSFNNGMLELSVEGYYKEMEGLIEYKEGTDFFLGAGDSNWQDKVETGGRGTAYGLEVLLQKKQGKTTGWIGYTYAFNWRKFDNINGGNRFPYRYDRRNDVSIVVVHQLSKKVNISGTWIYGTGNALTLPTGIVPGPERFNSSNLSQPINQLLGGFSGFGDPNDIKLYENGRNGFRMEPYHRMDLGVNLTKEKKWGTRTWSFSIYNVYSRFNPYSYVYRNQFDFQTGTSTAKLKKISLFPIIPSVSYSFKF